MIRPSYALAMLFIVLLISVAGARAVEVVGEFESEQQSELYHDLLREYRCLKCQNQNLADSNASLAGDLRREIRDQILDGKQKEDIDNYLVARYGEFVLYRPRFSAKTALLWIAPFVLLIVAISSVYLLARRRIPASAADELQTDHAQEPAATVNADPALQERLKRASTLLKE